MSTIGTWCDNLIIQAVANTLNCVILYLSVFHQQLAKLLDACGKKVDAALTEDALTDILLEMNDLNITFNLADNKLLHIN